MIFILADNEEYYPVDEDQVGALIDPVWADAIHQYCRETSVLVLRA